MTITCLGLVLVSLRLLGGGWRNPGLLPALISVPLFLDLLTAHVTSELGLTGLCLAAWAQPRRRWVLMGVGLAIGLIRPPNALPLLAVLVYSSWADPLGLLKAAVAGGAALLPLVALAFWLDPAWIATYSLNVGHTDYAGLPLVAIHLGGTWGLVLLQVATILVALYLARSRRGQPLDPDLAAYVIAIGVLSSKLAGPYFGHLRSAGAGPARASAPAGLDPLDGVRSRLAARTHIGPDNGGRSVRAGLVERHRLLVRLCRLAPRQVRYEIRRGGPAISPPEDHAR